MMVDRLEGLAPDDAEDQRRDQSERIGPGIARPDFAPRLRIGHGASDKGQGLGHQGVVPDLGQLGEVARIRR